MSCRTSEGNFHFSTFFVWYSLVGFSVPTTAFSIKQVSNFTCPGCPVGQVGWEVQLSDRYFQLSRAVGKSLISIPESWFQVKFHMISLNTGILIW